jgi:hypothetical protein
MLMVCFRAGGQRDAVSGARKKRLTRLFSGEYAVTQANSCEVAKVACEQDHFYAKLTTLPADLRMVGFSQLDAVLLSDGSHTFVEFFLFCQANGWRDLAGLPELPHQLRAVRKLRQFHRQLVSRKGTVLQHRKCRIILRIPTRVDQRGTLLPLFEPDANQFHSTR